MPPLPHHRAYGSVPRRFGGLSGERSRHRGQAQFSEAGVGVGAVQGVSGTEPPGSLPDEFAGRLLGDPETPQFLVAPTPRLPLDPRDAAQASADPPVQGLQLGELTEAEVSVDSKLT
jgi:hypothetical protein